MSVVWSDAVDEQAAGQTGPACVVETMTAALDAQAETYAERVQRRAVACAGLACSLTVAGLVPVLVFPGSGKMTFGCLDRPEFELELMRLAARMTDYGVLPIFRGREGKYSRTATWTLPGDLTVELTETEPE